MNEPAMEYRLLESMENFNWSEAYQKDPVFRKIYKKCKTDGKTHDGYMIANNLLYFTTSKGVCTYIPTTLLREILHIAHDVLGHGGYAKTYDRIISHYYRLKLAA